MDVKAGTKLEGHHLLEKIGEGHYGQVWKAEYLGEPVAVKVFHSQSRNAHLRQETIAQYHLGHLSGWEGEYFPRIEHVDLEAKIPYMRMEYVEGKPLEELLGDPLLSLEERLRLGEKVLKGLQVVHQNNLVHGDLSPANILVTPEGGVKLLDVGFGQVFDEGTDLVPSTTVEESSLGVASPLYAAPERFKSEFLEGCGKSSDLFSFGKILYQLITGENPFVIKPVSRKFPALGEHGDQFIFRCLEDRPGDRFPDASAALEEYHSVFHPEEAVPGEYRALCPKCSQVTMIPGGWAGELLLCNGCGSRLEVLHYNEDSKEAVTAFAELAKRTPGGGNRVTPGARKFCPSCGARILVEAKKCRVCKVWVNEYAHWVMNRKKKGAPPLRDFYLPFLGTLVAYAFLWLPGVILNYYYLQQADLERTRTGKEPPGRSLLVVLIWLFLWLPLISVALMGLAGLLMTLVTSARY